MLRTSFQDPRTDAADTVAPEALPDAPPNATAVAGPVTPSEMSEVYCPTEEGVGQILTSLANATVENMDATPTPGVESPRSHQVSSALPHGWPSEKGSAPSDTYLPLASARIFSRHCRGADGEIFEDDVF